MLGPWRLDSNQVLPQAPNKKITKESEGNQNKKIILYYVREKKKEHPSSHIQRERNLEGWHVAWFWHDPVPAIEKIQTQNELYIKDTISFFFLQNKILILLKNMKTQNTNITILSTQNEKDDEITKTKTSEILWVRLRSAYSKATRSGLLRYCCCCNSFAPEEAEAQTLLLLWWNW